MLDPMRPMRRWYAPTVALAVLLSAAAVAWVTGGTASTASAQSVAVSPVPSSRLPAGGMSPVASPESAAPAPRGPDSVAPTPIPGGVEVRRGADIVYMSRDGKYVIAGELFQVSNHADLTEEHRRELRRDLIAKLPESQMVV